MHVNHPSAGLPAVNAKNLTQRLFATLQKNPSAKEPPRDYQITPATPPKTQLPQIESATPEQVTGIAGAALDGCCGNCLEATDSSASQDSLQSLLDSWNTDNSKYDLNGDGTVNVFDLFQMLADHAQNKQNDAIGAVSETPDSGAVDPITKPDVASAKGADQVAANDATGVAAAPTDADNDEPAALSIDGLIAAWNSTDGQYDLNTDGTVNVQDLFQLLASLDAAQSDSGGDTKVDANSVNSLDSLMRHRTPAQHRLTEQKLQHMADRLVRELQNAGFVDHPPANVGDILDQLNLNSDQRQIMLSRIAARYPDGLGVSMIG